MQWFWMYGWSQQEISRVTLRWVLDKLYMQECSEYSDTYLRRNLTNVWTVSDNSQDDY